jgi:hypothetical protein
MSRFRRHAVSERERAIAELQEQLDVLARAAPQQERALEEMERELLELDAAREDLLRRAAAEQDKVAPGSLPRFGAIVIGPGSPLAGELEDHDRGRQRVLGRVTQQRKHIQFRRDLVRGLTAQLDGLLSEASAR